MCVCVSALSRKYSTAHSKIYPPPTSLSHKIRGDGGGGGGVVCVLDVI